MNFIIVDIPRTGTGLCAQEVYEKFVSLGWSRSSTGYLLQDVRQHSPSKIKTYGFRWTKSEEPVYPKGIPYQLIA